MDEENNNDDPGSIFGDELQYDLITPNFETNRQTNLPFTIGEDSQQLDKKVMLKLNIFSVKSRKSFIVT